MRDYRFREILETINYACYMVYDDDITGLREKNVRVCNSNLYCADEQREREYK